MRDLLRPYQSEALAKVRGALLDGATRIMVQAPTGRAATCFAAIESAGVEFIDENGGAGVRLKETIMTWANWIPAISTSTLLTVAGLVAGTYYKAKVEKNIQHNLDQKLEELKAKLRKDEETLKANLRSRDEQIAALRSGALSRMANRHAALDKRRLEAIELLWVATVKLGQLKNLSKTVRAIRMDYVIDNAAEQTQERRKFREIGEAIWKLCGLDNLKLSDPPDGERPFVSPIAWALFSAYRQVLTHAAMRSGLGRQVLADPKPMQDLVKSVLPHYADFIDQHGTGGFSYVVDELEEKLFAELVASLDGATSDDNSVKQAAEILKAVAKVATSVEPKVDLPKIDGLIVAD